mmetsp:Transcript_37614/g.82795  ORF Transcript_37614/g.82795 Transcript_37614/m.82795 type:complete len:361 (-) Transcript_37614:958-2040(-)
MGVSLFERKHSRIVWAKVSLSGGTSNVRLTKPVASARRASRKSSAFESAARKRLSSGMTDPALSSLTFTSLLCRLCVTRRNSCVGSISLLPLKVAWPLMTAFISRCDLASRRRSGSTASCCAKISRAAFSTFSGMRRSGSSGVSASSAVSMKSAAHCSGVSRSSSGTFTMAVCVAAFSTSSATESPSLSLNGASAHLTAAAKRPRRDGRRAEETEVEKEDGHSPTLALMRRVSDCSWSLSAMSWTSSRDWHLTMAARKATLSSSASRKWRFTMERSCDFRSCNATYWPSSSRIWPRWTSVSHCGRSMVSPESSALSAGLPGPHASLRKYLINCTSSGHFSASSSPAGSSSSPSRWSASTF